MSVKFSNQNPIHFASGTENGEKKKHIHAPVHNKFFKEVSDQEIQNGATGLFGRRGLGVFLQWGSFRWFQTIGALWGWCNYKHLCCNVLHPRTMRGNSQFPQKLAER